MSFSVSVIIPVYNAEKFIEKSIASALFFDEVNEVVVVDDGSTDNSRLIIKNYQRIDDRVKIFHHKGNLNKGRSASRNLGMLMAKEPYITFLDADDFYLENRFVRDKILLEQEDLDGTYNAVGFEFYRNTIEEEQHHFRTATLSKDVVPEELFENIVSSKLGYLHLNGLTIKRSVCDSIGFFNEDLVVAEDSDFIFKLAIKKRLAASSINNIVSKRGIHDTNIFNNKSLYQEYNLKLYESLIDWGLKNNISDENQDLLWSTLWVIKFRKKESLLSYIAYWGKLMIRWPNFALSSLSIKYFPIVRLRQELFPFIFN
ncbi:glycosyltransferase family 2 protein [Dokdonia sp. R78006]|uniref:glycosyltransferase family 2 protein n=1 Tax=Dokdonia sp. R78006 TaxID=3093866 RepID=UPI0036D37852